MDQLGHFEPRGWAAAHDDADCAATAVRVPKTAELVADHFRDQIVNGALIAGEYLPHEGVLTAALGIARPTLREALRILESERLIAVTRGARTGAQVLRPSLDPLTRHAAMLLRADGVTIADLFAAHLNLHGKAIAALCATPDRSLLAALHGRMASARRSLAADDLDDADVQLHGFARLLVNGAGNATLTLLATMVSRLLTLQRGCAAAASIAQKAHRHALLRTELRGGERLLALIAAGDGTGATAHWRDHLAAAHADWLADGAGERVVELPVSR